jgi:hypothetical protein
LAEVVPVTRPDLVYIRNGSLVIREVKTARAPYGGGRDEAYDKHLQIPFMISLLDAGFSAHYGQIHGAVELELLTPDDASVWTWSTEDPAVVGVARGDVRRAADDWHDDDEWLTQPGPHCGWCPVSRWCPDQDAWELSARQVNEPGAPLVGADEPPPF